MYKSITSNFDVVPCNNIIIRKKKTLYPCQYVAGRYIHNVQIEIPSQQQLEFSESRTTFMENLLLFNMKSPETF